MRKATLKTGAFAAVGLAVALSAAGCAPRVVVVVVDRCTDPASEKAAEEAQREQIDAEGALIDQAGVAIRSGNYADTIAALAEHRRRFPHGQHAGARDRMWNAVCAGMADARCHAQMNPAATWR